MTTESSAAPFEVHLDIDERKLIARIDDSATVPSGEYAFYLQRNGRKVETRWYSDDPNAMFSTPLDDAQFRAIGFIRYKAEGSTRMAASRPVGKGGKSASSAALRSMPVQRVDVAGLAAAVEKPEATRFDVASGSFEISCLLGPRKGDSLFVVLGGAVPVRESVTLPRFSRFSWAQDFPGTILCIADPTLTLDPDIRLGWYFGLAARDATSDIAMVVSAVARAIGVPSDRIVTYGSSGGGFAALQLAARLGDGATAIAINAQTDIMGYSVRDVNRFLTVCVGGLSGSEAIRTYGTRLSALKAWQTATARSARCLLVQNLRDHRHHEEHFLPFLRHFGIQPEGESTDGRMGALTYSYPNGHGAEPRSMLPSLLARARALRLP